MGKRVLSLPTLDRLNELFFYDEDDGELYHRTTRGAGAAGGVAGCVNAKGYVSVAVDNRRYLAHRLIWKMITGRDPVEEIDHKDATRKNNLSDNLREASSFQNCHNTGISRRNTSGVKGVYFNPDNNNWRASIMKDRKVYRLGSYKKLEDARAAVLAAREQLHGEFARTG